MKSHKYILNILLIVCLTVIALWFALKDNYQVVLQALSEMNPFALVVILLWGTLYTVVWGFVYAVYGRKYVKNYSITKGIIVAFVGSFFAGITQVVPEDNLGKPILCRNKALKSVILPVFSGPILLFINQR